MALLWNLHDFSGPESVFIDTETLLFRDKENIVWMSSSRKKYTVIGSILCTTFFLLYTNDLPDDAICDIDIYADDTSLYSKCD